MTGWDAHDAAAARRRAGAVAEGLPGTLERHEHGHTGWLVRGRRFAWLLVDHHGDGRLALAMRAAPGQQAALVGADPERWFVPAYLGARGWVAGHVDPGHDPDWDQLEHLLEQAWRLGAGVRAVAALDADRGAPPP